MRYRDGSRGRRPPFLNAPRLKRSLRFHRTALDRVHGDRLRRKRVYVRSFPGPVGQWQVSTGGGSSPNGLARERSCSIGQGEISWWCRIAIEDDLFRVEKTRQVGVIRTMPRQRLYSLHPDGHRVAIAAVPESTGPQNTGCLRLELLRRAASPRPADGRARASRDSPGTPLLPSATPR